MIIQGFNFDNTKSVRDFANSEEGKRILNDIPKGNEDFIFKIGEKVSANGIAEATITERYKNNGFCHYKIEWMIGKRKKVTHFSRERQQDLIRI